MNNKQMHDIVNSAIETISYNHLEASHKQLFLLIGLLGGGAPIEQLLHYSLGWDLFDGEVARVEEARNSLHKMIFDLKGYCLLLDGDNQRDRNSIRMHDVVRDVAISIAKKDSNLFLIRENGVELNAWHQDASLERCGAMVLRGCPQLLECPLLKLLFLTEDYNSSSPSIPDTVFEKTTKLKVLDMSGLEFSGLPSSLSFLKNLQTLRLENCRNMIDISQVGELKNLQILSFANSSIQELPIGIGQLCKLRLLDLSYCSKLKVIPAGLIAGLSRLEELKMRRGFDRWDAEKSNASLVELKHLTTLSTLEIAVSNAKLLSKDLDFEKWEKYEIIVGGMWGSWGFKHWLDQLEITRKICLQHSTTSINQFECGVKRLFKGTECLCLGELKDIKNVTPTLDGDGFLELKHLRIQEDYEIQYIVNAADGQQKVSFPSLESLHLSRLMKLQQLCNGQLMEESFSKLTTVTVENCDKLKSLFYFSMATRLRCLKEIDVSDCAALEEIVAEKGRDYVDVNTTEIVFAQLRKLSLKSLPKLKNFVSNQKSLITNMESEEVISEEAQFKSSMPFFEKVSFPELEELQLSNMFNLTHIWSHKLQEMPCCNLTRLTVQNCDNLKYLLTSSMITVFRKLQQLTIEDCAGMTQVVAKEEGETEKETIIFPQLSRLRLCNLSNLTTFYQGIEEMDSNETVQLLFNEKVQFPGLKTLYINNLDSIKAIWPNTMKKTQNWKKDTPTFQNLQKCELSLCKGLRHVFPAYVARSLNQLEKLSIEDCGVETIISYGDTELEEIKAGEVATTFTFPKVIHINLRKLSKLKSFYPSEHTILWPALEILQLYDCDMTQPSMLTLFSIEKVAFQSSMSFQNLLEMEICSCISLKYLFTPSVAVGLKKVKKMTITECSMLEVIVRNEEGEATIDTIAFPQLISLLLKDLPNLTTFYSGVEEMNSNENLDSDAQPLFSEQILFPRLEELEIMGMDSIDTIWQEQLLYAVDSFSNLKQVTVTNCSSLLKIFSFTMPTRSKINSKKKTGEFLTFQNLSEVRVFQCESLKCVFSDSVARSLNQLREVCIEDCGVETIIGDAESEERKVATTFTFPKLTSIDLKRLPRLECFYKREHTIEWPALKNLDVVGCDKISVLDFFSHPENQRDNSALKVFSRLEYMSIRSKDMTKILALCDLSPQPLHLTSLSITEFNDELVAFLSKFLSIIHQLQTFEIRNCTFQEILPCQGEVIDHLFLPQLTTLKLVKLLELTYICKQDQHLSFVPRILDRLAFLNVSECPRLTNLVPPFVSFSSLEELYVDDCGGLINLIQPSTARSLEKLRMLGIRECGMIEEIIGDKAGGDDEESSRDDEIIFSKLNFLSLDKLPRLTSFCSSRNYNFNFPSLDCVYVRECPNMKTFCGGITTTPNPWKGDLNTIIQQRYAEMEATRLATAIPSISSSKHFEVEAQTHENSAEELSETIMEGQNATDQEKVADLCEKDKGKEVEASPSCSSWTANSPDEAQGEVQILAAAVPTISPRKQIEEKVQSHDKPAGELVEPRKEEMNGGIYELVNQDQVREIIEEDLQGGNEVGMVTEPVKLADTCDKVEEQIIARPIASQQNDFEDLHASKQFIPLMSKVLEILQTRPLNNMSARHVQFMEDASRDLSDMNFPVEWLSPYVEKARKWLSVVDRAKAISEVELKIAQVEVQLQQLKETKKALEQENKVIAPSVDFDLDKPLYVE